MGAGGAVERARGLVVAQLLVALFAAALAGCGGEDRPPVLPGPLARLTITMAGAGQGNVASLRPGVFCGSGCTEAREDFLLGDRVTLVAFAGVGSYFAGWEGACSGRRNFCELTMDQAREAHATFRRRVDLPACDADRSVRALFTRSPIDLDRVRETTRLAELVPPGHVLPNPHMFIRTTIPAAGEPEAVVRAPGDVTITSMSASWDGQYGKYDYYIRFASCREVVLMVALVQDLTPALLARLGPPTSCESNDECRWSNLNVRLRAGDPVGRASARYHAVALEAYDRRQEPLHRGTARRYRSEHVYLQCPLDYFTDGDPQRTGSTLRARLVEGSADCGEVDQDLPGTARGAWVEHGAAPTLDEDARVGLLRDNNATRDLVFSVGTLVPGMPSALYRFPVDARPGTTNQPFERVTPGRVYCYDHLASGRRQRTPLGRALLVEMPDADHLRVEVIDRPDCASAAGWMVLSRDWPAITFER